MGMRSMAVADWEEAIPEHWDDAVLVDADRKGFFPQFEGKMGSNKPIIRNDDLTNKPGDLIRFQLITPLKSKGAKNAERLKGSEGKMTMGQMTVSPTLFRNAVVFDQLSEKEVNFSLVRLIREACSDWMARELDDRLLLEMMPVDRSLPSKQMWASNATGLADLAVGDIFQTEELGRIRAQLEHQGAKPFMTRKKNGQVVPLYAVVMDDYAAYNLMQDSALTGALKEALSRGEDNPIFTRAISMYMGMVIYVFASPASGIAQGSPLRPECILGKTSASSGLVLYLTSDGEPDGIEYTKFFPASGHLSLSADGTNATEIIAYSAKSDYSFTVSSLAANHLADLTIITQAAAASSMSLAVGKVLAFGAEAACRGWGDHPGRIYDTDDYGFVQGIGIQAREGVSLVENTRGINPNCLIMYHDTPEPAGT